MNPCTFPNREPSVFMFMAWLKDPDVLLNKLHFWRTWVNRGMPSAGLDCKRNFIPSAYPVSRHIDSRKASIHVFVVGHCEIIRIIGFVILQCWQRRGQTSYCIFQCYWSKQRCRVPITHINVIAKPYNYDSFPVLGDPIVACIEQRPLDVISNRAKIFNYRVECISMARQQNARYILC